MACTSKCFIPASKLSRAPTPTAFSRSSHMPRGSAVLSGHFCKKPLSLPSCFYWADWHLSVLYLGSGPGSCAEPVCADRAGPLFFTTLISQPVWCACRLLTLPMHQGKGYSFVPPVFQATAILVYSKINNTCYFTGIKEKALLFHQQSSLLYLKWIGNVFSRAGTLFLELQSKNL